jgi:molecular chaperone DnaK (HSP70)
VFTELFSERSASRDAQPTFHDLQKPSIDLQAACDDAGNSASEYRERIRFEPPAAAVSH